MPSSPAPRRSILMDRHLALGADEATAWNAMAIPQTYARDVFEEVVAVRTRAGLFDVSALQITRLEGGQAADVLDKLVSLDVAKLEPGSAILSAICNDQGGLVDDVMVIRDAPDRFRLSHGGGDLAFYLAETARDRDVTHTRDEDLHVLSLQGPLALDVLAPHTPFDLAGLGYFNHASSTLFGREVGLMRGGYSGERGYEVYCTAADAGFLWDSILEAGRPYGVLPASWGCLDIVRVEAALLFFPFEMPLEDTTPWEAGMAWTVDEAKTGGFRGKPAIMAGKGKERGKIAGVTVDHDAAVEAGAKLYRDGQEAGVVTTSAYSRYLMLSLALVHLKPELTPLGTPLEVDGPSGRLPARVVQIPFYDPLRLRTHPR